MRDSRDASVGLTATPRRRGTTFRSHTGGRVAAPARLLLPYLPNQVCHRGCRT